MTAEYLQKQLRDIKDHQTIVEAQLTKELQLEEQILIAYNASPRTLKNAKDILAQLKATNNKIKKYRYQLKPNPIEYTCSAKDWHSASIKIEELSTEDPVKIRILTTMLELKICEQCAKEKITYAQREEDAKRQKDRDAKRSIEYKALVERLITMGVMKDGESVCTLTLPDNTVVQVEPYYLKENK